MPGKRQDGQPRTWRRGRFLARWEVSSFQPHGDSARWWVTFAKPKDKALGTLLQRAASPVTVEFFGKVSEPGAYGHLGLYEREFVVERVREVTEEALAETEENGP